MRAFFVERDETDALRSDLQDTYKSREFVYLFQISPIKKALHIVDVQGFFSIYLKIGLD